MSNRTFLSAEWRHLAMLNYAVDPEILKPLLPHSTELDFFNGTTFLSLVGFRFLNTRVLGCAFPFHRHFDEVNLRFYVRQKRDDGWRRGVVFIKEIVPRQAIAFLARTIYGEPYVALPMRHKIEKGDSRLNVEFSWRRSGSWESVEVQAQGKAAPLQPGSQEEFITEHYWGFTKVRSGCNAYQVEHPRWNVWNASKSRFTANVKSLYGEQYVEALSAKPQSAFIAEGSPVIVRVHSQIPYPTKMGTA